jgi:hypothetical protein
MKAVRTSETSSTSTRLHGATSRNAVIFIGYHDLNAQIIRCIEISLYYVEICQNQFNSAVLRIKRLLFYDIILVCKD